MKYLLVLIMFCSPIFAFADHHEDKNEVKPDQVEPMDQSQKKMDSEIGKNRVGPAPTNKKAKKPFASKEEKAKDDKKSAY
ncbi:hypothetical protein DOM22_13900 [Bdellovibrio sp. ZAP7]|uniref:hypothetical protein n=1 Tax=Bdellovibrio sp. ZAP7 TaxID=2231053 RepID=UPI00115B4EB5|nr:hypothetical protein [Bdellovibrio sp. ZAP7]QDK46179.1 hypothetical protein DOM22_13900 [Bdellovibrio sp. ZAP7]